MKLRINYIDNLRTIMIFLLIPYHLAMAYNIWGEPNYIFIEENKNIASIVVFMSSWFMPVMFLLAGISAFFSLKKRTGGVFLKERFRRLGIPLLLGVIFVNPILSYVADKTHNGYNGNYFEHYAVYFTRFTDLTGYDGGFTLGHLWFIVALMLISCIGYGIIKVIDRLSKNDRKILCIVDCIMIVISITSFDITIGGKKIVTYLGVYLMGYFLFSQQSFIEKLMKYKGFIISVFIIVSVMNVALYVYIGNYEIINEICNCMSFIAGIPAMICIGKMYLDYTNEMCSYCSELSYIFYIVHLPVVVLCQCFISLVGMEGIYNLVLSFAISIIITCSICFMNMIFRRRQG